MAGEIQPDGISIHAEHRDVVTSRVAGIEALPGGIKIEASWIVSMRPFLADELQLPVLAHRKYSDAVMQAATKKSR